MYHFGVINKTPFTSRNINCNISFGTLGGDKLQGEKYPHI
jgi:hypothetical protein